jgi:hypothetical protein
VADDLEILVRSRPETSDGLPWVVEEIDPAPGEAPMVVRLYAARGVAPETTENVVRTLYPGNPVASLKMMGADHEPLTLTGILRDDWLGAVGEARETYRKLRLMQRRAKRLYLSWGDMIDLSGVIERIRAPIEREGFIRYELTFCVAANEREPAAKSGRAVGRAGTDAARQRANAAAESAAILSTIAGSTISIPGVRTPLET